MSRNGVPLKIRMGEWDAANTNEPIPYQEFTVTRIFVHPQYNPTTLANSIAILRLSTAVPLGQVSTITTGCLPGKNEMPIIIIIIISLLSNFHNNSFKNL